MKEITPHESKRICRFILDRTGISVDPAKNRFLETRLAPLLDRYGAPDYWTLLTLAKSDMTGAMAQHVVDAISTNETRFFRDSGPFEILKTVILPQLTASRIPDATGRIPLRIWSAACSTGQEVFSIAIMLKETLADLSRYNITLVGTDISERALMRAKQGVYSKYEVAKGMPPSLLHKYFTPCTGGWKIRDEIKALTRFGARNLLQPVNRDERWDVIFCRNVAIYFRQPQRKRLFEQFADILEPDGYLIAGASESLAAICSRYAPRMFCNATFYQRRF